jgi:hypothetical protein
MLRSTKLTEFNALRPRLRALLEMHRTANTEEGRATLVELMEDVFLATAWHVAQDLLDHGWSPGALPPRPVRTSARLRVVGGTDAA